MNNPEIKTEKQAEFWYKKLSGFYSEGIETYCKKNCIGHVALSKKLGKSTSFITMQLYRGTLDPLRNTYYKIYKKDIKEHGERSK